MKASSHLLLPLLVSTMTLANVAAPQLHATPDLNVVPILSYDYLPVGTPNPVYPDNASQTRLSDGELGTVGSWFNGAFVLWTNASPEISFNFAQEESIASFSIYLLNEPGAGIVVPEEIRVTSNSDPSISYTFHLDRADFPIASADWVSFNLPELMVTDGITLWTSPATGWGTDWMGFSEVQFQSIPEPSSLALVSLAGAFALLAFRRKKTSF